VQRLTSLVVASRCSCRACGRSSDVLTVQSAGTQSQERHSAWTLAGYRPFPHVALPDSGRARYVRLGGRGLTWPLWIIGSFCLAACGGRLAGALGLAALVKAELLPHQLCMLASMPAAVRRRKRPAADRCDDVPAAVRPTTTDVRYCHFPSSTGAVRPRPCPSSVVRARWGARPWPERIGGSVIRAT